MKYIKTLVFSALLLAFLAASADPNKPNQPESSTGDAMSNLLLKKAQAEKTLKKLTDEIADLQAESRKHLDNINKEKNAKIDSLTQEIDAAKKKNEAAIEPLDNRISKLQYEYIDLIVKFVYLPYDQYCVDELAKPAVDAVKDTPLADNEAYQNVIPLVMNYKTYANEIIKFCSDHEKDNPAAAEDGVEGWRKETQKVFDDLPAVVAFKRFGEGWQATCLGGYIDGIYKTISQTNDQNTATMQTNLKKYRVELENMIKKGSY